MTAIELLDTALKIGLGAAIGAGGSLIAIKLNAQVAADQERRRRRLDIVEKAALDFESTFQVFLRLYSTYNGYLSPPVEPSDSVGVQAMTQVRQETWSKLTEMMSKDVPEALHTLNAIDASLLLVGATDSSKCAEQFRLAATDLQSCLVMINDLFGHPTPSRETVTRLGNEVSRHRLNFYNALRQDYSIL